MTCKTPCAMGGIAARGACMNTEVRFPKEKNKSALSSADILNEQGISPFMLY